MPEVMVGVLFSKCTVWAGSGLIRVAFQEKAQETEFRTVAQKGNLGIYQLEKIQC